VFKWVSDWNQKFSRSNWIIFLNSKTGLSKTNDSIQTPSPLLQIQMPSPLLQRQLSSYVLPVPSTIIISSDDDYNKKSADSDYSDDLDGKEVDNNDLF